FFQAEDGIRDFHVTGVQTCALPIFEPLITLAKQDSVANRRLAFARTRDKDVVGKLFNELGPRYQERAGGYTRIMKCGFRAGDNAPMAYIELVDRPELDAAAAEVAVEE